MKIKVSETNVRQLNWMVGQIEGINTIKSSWEVQYIPYESESDDSQGFVCFAADSVEAVERCESIFPDCTVVDYFELPTYSPVTDWYQGGRIIERENIQLKHDGSGFLRIAHGGSYPNFVQAKGPTPLIAAMRCYVATKLGNEVDVPEELL